MPDDENKRMGEGADISGMFKGLAGAAKSSREISFEPSYSGAPKVIKWLMKLSGGLIKNEKQAQYALLGLVILAIIVSLILFFGGGPQKPILQEDIPQRELQPLNSHER